jgi:bifunctional non-homologous end joining protein LigD
VPLPRIEPLRPVLAREVPRGGEWLYEPKLDGFRGVLHLDGGRGAFSSKNMKPLNRFDDLAQALARTLPGVDAILDGEVIVMGKNGPRFYDLMFGRGRPEYAAFDLLWLNGKDLRPLPLWQRKRALAKLIRNVPVGFVESTANPRLFDVAAEMDLEGIVAKRRADPYGPATRWVKVKHSGYSQNEGRWQLFQKRR